MSEFHSTAIIDRTVRVSSDVVIGPYVVIGPDSSIGPGSRIMHGAHIGPWTDLGANNLVYPGAIVGQDPQDLTFGGERSWLKIGDENTIREGCTIHRGRGEDSSTVIGSHNYFMANSHVAHNCIIGERVILVNGALLGGHCEVMNGAIVSGNCAVHQFVRIGRLAMMRGGSMASRDIPPFCVHDGQNRVRALNLVGLKRNGFKPEDIRPLREAFKIIFRSGKRLPQALDLVDEKFGKFPTVQEMLSFIRTSQRGICSGRRSILS